MEPPLPASVCVLPDVVGDIPAALEREVRREPATSYVFGRPLGPHPVLQEMLDGKRRLEAIA